MNELRMDQYRYFLPDEILLAIGRIAVNFAIVEGTIAFYSEALLAPRDPNDVGRAVTANMSFKNLVHLLSSVHRLRVDDRSEQQRLDALLSRALHSKRSETWLHTRAGHQLTMQARLFDGKQRPARKGVCMTNFST